MRLTQLQYFVRVAELGSVNAASRDLHVSQPAISTAIHNLEEELGVLLFSRSRQRMELTEAGILFYRRASESLRILDDSVAELQGYTAEREIIRFGIPPMIGLIYIPALMHEFTLRYPDINLRITEANARELSQKLNNRELDLALMLNESPNATGFDRRPLLNTKYSFFVGQGNPLIDEDCVSLSTLAKVPLILFDTGLFLNQYINQAFRGSTERPTIAFASSQINSVKNYVRQSQGGTFLIRECVRPDDELVEVQTAITPSVTIAALWLKGTSLSTSEKKLLRFLEKQHMNNE